MQNYVPRFVVVSGLIGVGKSTFTKQLADNLGYRAIYEPVEDNPYLADFYQDPHTWAYPMQEFLKHRRFAAYQFAAWGLRHGEWPGVILDRSIHEDTVFAEINQQIGTIHPRNWDTYLQGFQDFTMFLPEPDVYVFLDAAPETCRERANSRNRPEEQTTNLDEEDEEAGIPLSYMRTLHEGYKRWLAAITPRIPTVRLDWSSFQRTDEAWKSVVDQVEQRNRFTRSLVV